MKLYICYRFLKSVTRTPRPGGHPCGNALKALKEAGYDPEVQPVGGIGLPLLDRTSGRQEVKRLTGKTTVPVLVTDDGTVIPESRDIAAWARANPAGKPSASA